MRTGSFLCGCLALLAVLLAAGCDEGPPAVSIRTGNPPALIAFRDDASTEWQVLAAAGVTAFEVAVTGPYRVVVVCETTGEGASVGVAQYARTPEDEPLIEHTCRSATYPFELRGQMVQSGQVSFGGFGMGTTGSNWDFVFPAARGSSDLVMLSGNFTVALERIAIRRGVAITGNTELGMIDLTQESSHALVPTPVTATNLAPGESQSSRTLLITDGTTATLQNSFLEAEKGWTARLAPDGALRATDRQRVVLAASGAPVGTQSRARAVQRDARVGAPTSVTLPEPLGAVTFEMSTHRLTAAWSALPEIDEVSVVRQSFANSTTQTWTHRITLSRAFLEASGATSTAIDLRDVPGFKPEWDHDPTFNQLRAFTATRRSSAEIVSSTASEWIDPTASAGAQGADAIARNPAVIITPRPDAAGEIELAARW